MDPEVFDERYVTGAALAVDLPLPAGHLASVTENVRRIAAVAAPILATPLEPEDEVAPVWRP